MPGVSSDHQQAAEATNTGLPRGRIGSRVAGEPVQGLDGQPTWLAMSSRNGRARQITLRDEASRTRQRGNRQLQQLHEPASQPANRRPSRHLQRTPQSRRTVSPQNCESRDPDGKLYILAPCGYCRQFMRDVNEANLEADVILGRDKVVKLKDLLSHHEWSNPS